MKIRDGFMLREIAGSWMVIPIGQRVVEFNGMMRLSESGALLWSKLEKGAEESELVPLLLKEYEVDEETAHAHVKEFISAINQRGLIAV